MSVLDQAQALFDRIKLFPESYDAKGSYLKPGALSAFLDLRQLFEREILPLLSNRTRDLPDASQEMVEAAWEVLEREGTEAPPVEVMVEMIQAIDRAR